MKKRTILVLILAACFTATAGTIDLKLEDPADYGSGSMSVSVYIAGGIQGMGIIAGHANACPVRKDRILMKFALGRLYLAGKPEIASAKLTLCLRKLWNTDGKQREISVWSMNFEPVKFSAADLANPDVTFCAKAKTGPETFTFDVTDAVKQAFAARRGFVSFRITDSAEQTDNITRAPRCIIFRSPSTDFAGFPELAIEYKNHKD